MRFRVRQPSPALAPFVRSLWSFEAELPHLRERILPTGTLQLLINLHQDELRSYPASGGGPAQRIRGAALCGAHDHPFAIDTAEQRAIIGVDFSPGGALPFFRAPAQATAGEHVELESLWGLEGRLVRERLCEIGDPDQRLQALEQLLLERAVRPLTVDPAVRFAVHALGSGVAVGAVLQQLGMAHARFIRVFSEAVGLTPKRFARVQRFQRLLAAVRRGAGRSSWAEAALAAGYFDQAHLIHEFRALAGATPSEYRPRSEREWNHVPL
jgi:AraC-like DNA-binding protein